MSSPSLTDLEVFAGVAAARSFRGAAAKRGVSASSLSEGVRRLEKQLKTRLLNRTTRSVTLTDAGRRLLETIAPALAALGDAMDAVTDASDQPAGRLRLTVPVVAAETILPDIATRFLAAHPRIALEVVADNNFVDIVADGFDAGIRYEERLERDMIAMPIGPLVQRSVLAAAPTYIERHGAPTHPRELVDRACLAYRFDSGIISHWEFEKGKETLRITPRGPLVTSSLVLLQAAARDGLGLIFLFEDYLGADLASGALTPLLEDWWPSFTGPRLFYPSRLHKPPPLCAFLDFLREQRAQTGTPQRV